MKKVFISQYMWYKTNEEIKKEREVLLSYAKEKFGLDTVAIDNFFEGAPFAKKPAWFLGKSIELLSDAEVVIMAPDWENGRGCVIEHDVAKKYGIQVEYAPEELFSYKGKQGTGNE